MDNLAYQDNVWEELIDGVIVAMSPRPSPRHYITADNIYGIFKKFLAGKPCKAYMDAFDVHLTEKDIVIPDVLILCDKDKLKKDGIHGAPDLIVEVLSPNTAKRDKGYKKDLYEKCGVKEYWIADPENRLIEVYLPDKNGKYVLADVYYEHEFKTSLFDGLIINTEEVFEGL